MSNYAGKLSREVWGTSGTRFSGAVFRPFCSTVYDLPVLVPTERAAVHEEVLAAGLRLDEAEALELVPAPHLGLHIALGGGFKTSQISHKPLGNHEIHCFSWIFNENSWILMISQGFLGNLRSIKSTPQSYVQA